MKRDIWGHEKRYLKWKEEYMHLGIDGLTKNNSDILVEFILDMEVGVNVSNKNVKGGRSYPRLNNLRQRLAQMIRLLQERGVKDITKISEAEINKFFSEMRKGIIKTAKDNPYRSVADYTKIFKSFWRWYMKSRRKIGVVIPNITEDLDTTELGKKPFVYLKKDDLDKMLPYFEENEQVILLFVYDSLIRSPGELLNLKTSDMFKENGEVWVNIPEEISKTFGRSFNLLYSGEALLKYIERNKLQPNDYLFNFSSPVFTSKIQEVAGQVFGDRISDARAGEYYKNMTLYDLRHSGAIHLRVMAKENPENISIDAIRHRGGWTDFDMLNYYTQFIGLDGKIDKKGLLIKQDKTQLENDINMLKKDNQELRNAAKLTLSAYGMLLESVSGEGKINPTVMRRLREMHSKGEASFLKISQDSL